MNDLWTYLLHAALANALTVAPLSLAAWGVSRCCRQPALTHALWVLVLVKLVTPPLIQLPVSIDMPLVARPAPPADLAAEPLPTPTDATVVPMLTAAMNPSLEIAREGPTTSRPTSAKRPAGSAQAPLISVRRWISPLSWRNGLLTIWLLGSGAWFTGQGWRALRFSRRIRAIGILEPTLDAEVRRLAGALGRTRSPRVLVVDAVISPMLWGCGGRARILLPADLTRRLDNESRMTLLMHELAHYVRGDHWIRVLELAVLGLFWWHPAVWWARREIENSEEECCDAWVVGEFPAFKRRYATALLDTIDFLCEPRISLPPVASGLGEAAFLRRRLTRIMRDIPADRLSRSLRGLLALVATVLLPCQPFVLASPGPKAAQPPVQLRPGRTSAKSSPAARPETDEGKTVPAPVTRDRAVDSDRSLPTSRKLPRASRGERTLATALSPDGRFLISATSGYRVTLIDLTTMSETDLSSAKIAATAFSVDGRRLFTAGADGRIVAWDCRTGAQTHVVARFDEPLRSIAAASDGQAVAVGGTEGLLQIVDLETGLPRLDAPRQNTAVNCVRYSPDGTRLAVACGEWNSTQQGEVSIWDLQRGTVQGPFRFASSPGAVAFASNDELVVGQWDGQASLWNLATDMPVAWAAADKDVVTAAAFSPDSPLLLEVEFAPAGLGTVLGKLLLPGAPAPSTGRRN